MATERKLPEVGEEIHLPGPSAQPLMIAVSFTIMLIGVTSFPGIGEGIPVMFIIGAVWFTIVLFQWIRDARAEFAALPDHHGDHAHGHPEGDPMADPTDHGNPSSHGTSATANPSEH